MIAADLIGGAGGLSVREARRNRDRAVVDGQVFSRGEIDLQVGGEPADRRIGVDRVHRRRLRDRLVGTRKADRERPAVDVGGSLLLQIATNLVAAGFRLRIGLRVGGVIDPSCLV